jgi:hypothetical protein
MNIKKFIAVMYLNPNGPGPQNRVCNREQESKTVNRSRGRPEVGDRLAGRELGISRDEVRRAQTIGALPQETKRAARRRR